MGEGGMWGPFLSNFNQWKVWKGLSSLFNNIFFLLLLFSSLSLSFVKQKTRDLPQSLKPTKAHPIYHPKPETWASPFQRYYSQQKIKRYSVVNPLPPTPKEKEEKCQQIRIMTAECPGLQIFKGEKNLGTSFFWTIIIVFKQQM